MSTLLTKYRVSAFLALELDLGERKPDYLLHSDGKPQLRRTFRCYSDAYEYYSSLLANGFVSKSVKIDPDDSNFCYIDWVIIESLTWDLEDEEPLTDDNARINLVLQAYSYDC